MCQAYNKKKKKKEEVKGETKEWIELANQESTRTFGEKENLGI